MSTAVPKKSAQGQDGLSLATTLHPCVASAVILVGEGQKILMLTREARQIIGLEQGPPSKEAEAVLPSPLATIAREALKTGQPITGRVLDLPAPQPGKGRSVCVTAAPLLRAGRAEAVVLAINDLRSENQCELHLERLDRLAKTGTLAAGMVHEIKNALVASRTFMDLLLEKNQDAELADVVRRELIRIDSIVTRLLKFSGPADENFAPTRVHDVLEHSMRLIQPQLKGKGIELRTSFQAGQDAVQANEYELQQAFVNLLLNALEAMTANGVLTISTAVVAETNPEAEIGKRPSQIHATIQDTGAGIPPENMPHLFEPFFTTKASGTGLGLAVTQRIIEGHGGTIEVQSNQGAGTTFTIALPLSA